MSLPDEMVCAILEHVSPVWLAATSLTSTQWLRCSRTIAISLADRVPGCNIVPPLGADVMDCAAKEGHESLVMWLRIDHGVVWTARTLEVAAEEGHAGLVRHMLAPPAGITPCAVDDHCLLAAFIGGGFPLAQSVHEARQPWTKAVMLAAIVMDDADAVGRLIALDCPHDEITIALAICLHRSDVLDVIPTTHDEMKLAVHLVDVIKRCLMLRDYRHDILRSLRDENWWRSAEQEVSGLTPCSKAMPRHAAASFIVPMYPLETPEGSGHDLIKSMCCTALTTTLDSRRHPSGVFDGRSPDSSYYFQHLVPIHVNVLAAPSDQGIRVCLAKAKVEARMRMRIRDAETKARAQSLCTGMRPQAKSIARTRPYKRR